MRGVPTLSIAAVAALLLLCGCGTDRKEARTATPGPSKATKDVEVPRAGLSVKLPRDLAVSLDMRGPAVFKATIGEPFLSAFAYRRREQLPRTASELAQARDRLSRTVRDREPGYRLLRAGTTEVDGARAVELVGTQTLSRRRLQIRSLHVFKGSAEYVIEIVAPVGQFKRFDGVVTPLIRRTLDVSGTVAR